MFRLIATTTLVFASAALTWADDANSFQWQGDMSPGQTLAIRGINSGVTADLAPGTQAQVTAVKSGIMDNPALVQIQVVTYDGGVVICAVYPNMIPNQPDTCVAPGTMKAGQYQVSSDVQVQFTVHVPAGVLLDVTEVNGDIRANGLTAAIHATTVNGQIAISTSGTVQATTVNGSIVATLSGTDWSGSRSFTTVNGSIDVGVPASADLVVHASTVSGAISTDFPLAVRNANGFMCGSGATLNGTIGSGAGALNLTTVNGSIHLRKSQ